jgi:sugar phosphate isomerase/epimerase
MRFGGSTFSYMWKSDALAAMRDLQAIGVNDFDIIAVPGHLWADDLDAGARRTLRAALASDGIRVESLNLPSVDQNLASCVPSARAYAVDVYAETLHLAADLGVRNVVAVAGRAGALLPPTLTDSMGWLEESLGALLRIAEENDQRIYLEMIPLSPISKVDDLVRFLDRFAGASRLLVAYDVANAEFVGEDQVAALRRIGKRLGQTHLSDSTRTTWRHDRVGLGSVNFEVILRELRAMAFDGVNVLEIISNNPRDDFAESLRLLAA